MRSGRAAVIVCLLALVGVVPAHAATAVDAPTKAVKVGKQKVGYRSFGSGPPVVMVMGLGGTMGSWDPTVLDSIAAAGHRVVVFDNEGVGRSTARKGLLTIRRMADTTAGLIKRLRIRRADVVGWSMGGMIAQSLAVRHPRLVRRLGLLATAPGDGKGTAPRPDALRALTGGAVNDPTAALALLFPADQTAARDSYVRNILLRRPFEGVAPAAVREKQTAAAGAWLLAQDPDGKRVARLTLPTLVGGGELDPLLPVENQRRLNAVIAGSTLVTYPDASHGFFMQHAADFVPRLTAFLAR